MSFYLKALRGVFVSDNSNHGTRLQQVETLRQKLVNEGYQPSEAEHFIKVALGSRKIERLDNRELDTVIEYLEKQIEIAQKCKNLF
ncbi:hypothetical protein JCM14036_07970 [Desulfotomaculum defluvii]